MSRAEFAEEQWKIDLLGVRPDRVPGMIGLPSTDWEAKYMESQKALLGLAQSLAKSNEMLAQVLLSSKNPVQSGHGYDRIDLESKVHRLMEHVEFLEDSLDAHLALQEFKESGESAVDWNVAREFIHTESDSESAEITDSKR